METNCIDYKIKSGKHYSNQWFYKIFNSFFFKIKRLSYKVTFNKNCLYTLNNNDKYDINKLFGFSLGYHHIDSARFGWSVNGNSVDIFCYCYIDGKRTSSFLLSVVPEKEYKFTIFGLSDCYVFLATDSDNQVKRKLINKTKSRNKWGYKLWPYFGGNQKAPHDMNIYLEEN